MQTKYLYSCVNTAKLAQIEHELHKQFPKTLFQVKENLNTVRSIIEIEHSPEEGEAIETFLAKYEDNWTEVEIEAWLEKRDNQEENAISLVNLMKSSMYSELDYYRLKMFDEGIPSTIIEQRNFYDFNATTYQLQINRNYLADALALLRKDEEDLGEEEEITEEETENLLPKNLGRDLVEVEQEVESPFEPLLRELNKMEKDTKTNLVLKLALVGAFVVALVIYYFFKYQSKMEYFSNP